jgi:transposase
MTKGGLLMRVRGARAWCAKCGVYLTNHPIDVVRQGNRWVCSDRSNCRWRRQRALDARQTTFDFGATSS